MSKLSERLRAALAARAMLRTTVNVLLDARLPRQRLSAAAATIGRLPDASAVQFLHRLAMVSLLTPLNNVAALEGMEEVTWIDLATDIPLTDLLDGKGPH